MRWFEKFWFILVAACVFTSIPLGLYAWLPPSGTREVGYQWARVAAASLSVFVTALAALGALAQYRRNSRETRIERSMSFWRRANGAEFIEHQKPFVEYWISKETQGHNPSDCFERIAKSDGEELNVKLSIEYLLDFYDEACSGVVMGACDEDAMYYYLGAIMRYHAQRLGSFVRAWREKHGRPEKWDVFSSLTHRWERCTTSLPSGKPFSLPR